MKNLVSDSCGVPALLTAVLGTVFAVAAWTPAAGEGVELVDRAALRVCADPANMPFSNDKGEGFENKIAELIAADLKVPVEYTWFPQATGFIRNTLFAKQCDVVMGYAQGDELVLNTNPYYRSTYTLVYRPGHGLDGVDSLADPRLRGKRLGVVAGTPPSAPMIRLGLMQNAKPYPLVVDRRFEAPGQQMISDIRTGDIDAGVLWGPMAGYFSRKPGEKLAVVPLLHENGGPGMAYRITFGVRPTEDDWKHQLNDVIAKRQGDIDAILLSYGVPLLDDRSNLITAPRR